MAVAPIHTEERDAGESVISSRKQRGQDHRADLDYVIAAPGDHKKRFLQSERNNHNKDHAEHGLENRIVGRIETFGQSQAKHNLHGQVPDSHQDDDRNQRREYRNDDAFEALIQRKQLDLLPGNSCLIQIDASRTRKVPGWTTLPPICRSINPELALCRQRTGADVAPASPAGLPGKTRTSSA
jgi:hypothetical protein